jgi:hypothetical protein
MSNELLQQLQEMTIRDARVGQKPASQELKPSVSSQAVKAVDPIKIPSSSATNAFDWSLLPTEIRMMILGHFLSFPRAITEKNNDILIRMRVLALLITKDENFVARVKEMYFGGNTFRVTPEVIAIGRSPSLSIGEHIRKLEIVMLSLPRHCFALRHTYATDGKQEWLTKWEASLPNIKKLSVILKVRETYHYETEFHESVGVCGLLHEGSLTAVSNALKPKFDALQPKHFSFTVDCGDNCPYPSSAVSLHPGMGCNCAREFEEAMKKLITAS